MKNNSMKKVALYIHIPFCIQKCPYCDFYSIPLQDRDILDRYTHSLIREIDQVAAKHAGLKVETIYFGGGTPSLLLPHHMHKLIEAIKNKFDVEDNAEISMEANPYHHNTGNLSNILDAGINRLSLGVQSFFDEELRTLGRIHNSYDVLATIDELHKIGLDNFSLDFIYGIPGQSLENWQKNLQQAVECGPRHISMYLLQLDEKTPMARNIKKGKIKLLDEDTELLMYYTGIDYLQNKGFKHYEISNFSLTGSECKHNLYYWDAREYLGIGPGAVSFINNKRYMIKPSLDNYMFLMENGRNADINILEEMSADEIITDAIILGLRLIGGINRQEFKKRFNIDILCKYHQAIDVCILSGLLKLENESLMLTRKGYFLSNQVFCQFIT